MRDDKCEITWFDKLLSKPVSSGFENDEELARKKRIRKQKINETIKKAAAVSREGLNIYYQMREKNFFSIGLGLLSTYGAVSKHIMGDTDLNPTIMLNDMGYNLLTSSDDVSIFLRGIYKNINIPMEIYWKNAGANIEEYKVDSILIYFINHINQEYIEGPFVKNKEEFYNITSNIIEKKFGRYICLNTVRNSNSWQKSLNIESITPYEDAYVSPINEEKLIHNINTFFDNGMNRSLLFYGPPGSGKSTLALRLTKALGGKILILNGWSLARKTTGSIFNVINIVDPSIILFDDLDRINNMESLLSDLEQLNKDTSRRKRLFIATVNNISKIPAALRRPGRFDQAIEFKAHVEKDVCKQILKAHADRLGLTLSNDNFDKLSNLANGMTGAYLREIVRRVFVLGMDEIEEHINNMLVTSADDDDE